VSFWSGRSSADGGFSRIAARNHFAVRGSATGRPHTRASSPGRRSPPARPPCRRRACSSPPPSPTCCRWSAPARRTCLRAPSAGVPRIRDWMFSSVVSAFIPQTAAPARECIRQTAADADHLKADAEVRRQLAAVVDGARRGIRARHADPSTFSAPSASLAMAATSAESMPPLSPTSTLLESRTCARNRACPAPAPGRRPRCRPLRSDGQSAGASKGSTTTRSSSNEAACAISSPLRIQASEEPSKIRLSLPPTWFTSAPARRPAAQSPPASRAGWRACRARTATTKG
jgi:hypothetical protein